MTTSFLQRDRRRATETSTTRRPGSAGRRPRRRRLGLRARWPSALRCSWCCLVAIWIIAFSSLLGVRTVDVHGEHSLTAAQIETAARHRARARRSSGSTPRAVTRRVETLPDVASAECQHELPEHRRDHRRRARAVGYIRVGGRASCWSTAPGAQFRTVAARRPGLPLFVAARPGAGGSRRAPPSPRWPGAAPRAARAGALDPGPRPDRDHAGAVDGRLVPWGSASANAHKAACCRDISTGADTVVDVSDLNQPFSR